MDVSSSDEIKSLIARLEPEIEFAGQVQFDTLTWRQRHIGTPASNTILQIELFELFDDPFVKEQFSRRKSFILPQIGIDTWIPTPEDIIVQKLRWGRSKDLEDARDILAVEGPETLDMPYIENWCTTHGTTARLKDTLARIPKL